jgi:sugar phosphate isomerase/epimerase
VKALKKYGIPIVMMVTDITDAENPLTEKVLGAASQAGIKYYRLGYFNYDRTKSIPANLDGHKKAMEKLEKVNRKYGIHGGYQNHSGTNVGGPVWDLHWIVKDCDPQFIGVQYDIRHAVAEGGVAWPLGLDLLAPWIKTSAIKDFYWKKNNNKWILQNVPLGEGMVDFDAYLKQYIKLGIKGPFTLHLEYDLGGAETGKTKTTMPLDQIRTYLKNDLEWFRKKLASAGIA